MKKRLQEKQEKKKKKHKGLFSKILHCSWIRFEERIPEPHKDDEEEHSMWFRNF